MTAMSADLYTKRLYWQPAPPRGVAKLNGVSVALTEPPQFPGMPLLRIEWLDYAPEVKTWQIMPKGGGWREMAAWERDACEAFLRLMTYEPASPES